MKALFAAMAAAFLFLAPPAQAGHPGYQRSSVSWSVSVAGPNFYFSIGNDGRYRPLPVAPAPRYVEVPCPPEYVEYYWYYYEAVPVCFAPPQFAVVTTPSYHGGYAFGYVSPSVRVSYHRPPPPPAHHHHAPLPPSSHHSSRSAPPPRVKTTPPSHSSSRPPAPSHASSRPPPQSANYHQSPQAKPPPRPASASSQHGSNSRRVYANKRTGPNGYSNTRVVRSDKRHGAKRQGKR